MYVRIKVPLLLLQCVRETINYDGLVNSQSFHEMKDAKITRRAKKKSS